MGLQAIEKEICETVSKEAGLKVAQAEEKSGEILHEAHKTVEEEQNKSREDTEKLVEHIKSIAEASAKFEVKKIELSSKKEIINKTFLMAENKIRHLDITTKKKLSLTLLDDAKKQMEVEYVLCNTETTQWIPSGLKVKKVEILGGIIAENKDTTLRVDNSFETLLEEIRKDALGQIAKKIF